MAISPGVGRDVLTLNGEISADLRITSGPIALLDALMRRFNTAHNSWPIDRDYGCGLSQWCNETEPETDDIRSRIESECLKDERVNEARAFVSFDGTSGDIVADVRVGSTFGAFVFTVGIDSVTTKLLAQTIDVNLGL